MKKKKLKGFTLIELIIVLALFGLIMYSVMQLIEPVSKFFVRSSNFENTTACLDNMKRSIEGNLKFADRVRVYENYNPYMDSYASHSYDDLDHMNYSPSGTLQTQVEQFYDEFFEERVFLDSSGVIYVMVFDNTQLISDADLRNNYTKLSDYNTNGLNSGKIVMYQYPYNSEDGTGLGTPTITEWYVNQKLYGAFDYRFTLGAFSGTVGSAGSSVGAPGASSFNPADCTVTITANEIRRVEQQLVRQETYQDYTASFSMKNVLDSSVRYTTALFDYKTILNPDYDGTNITAKYLRDEGSAVPRYVSLQTGDEDFDGFYFIFTMPETTHDNVDGSGNAIDSAYVNAVESAYAHP